MFAQFELSVEFVKDGGNALFSILVVMNGVLHEPRNKTIPEININMMNLIFMIFI